MAKPPAKVPAKVPAKSGSKAGAKGKGAAKGKSKKGLATAFVILGIGSVFVLAASVVAFAGLIPTFVTAMTDKSRAGSVTVAVGSLNLVGVVYIVIQVFQKGIRLDYAMQLLQDPLNWLIMWGGAGIGMTLINIIPPMVAQVLTSISEFKLQKLKNNQVEIRKMWGEDVKG